MTRRTPWIAATLAPLLLVGCTDEASGERVDLEICFERRFTAEIDPAGRALLVNEPEALVGLSLEDVLQHLLDIEHDDETTPLELLQSLFDTSNDTKNSQYSDITWHCDAESPAHENGPAAFCPRAEGALARSTGFFTPGDPDYFYPVAAVNRMDLAPDSYAHCGEARIVYAKASGLTRPENRVFLIFEAALRAPLGLKTCQMLADRWYELQSKDSPKEVSLLLRRFFFERLPGYGPVLSARSLGFGNGSAAYYGDETPGGHLRVSQHVEQPWEMRELLADLSSNGRLRFKPMPVGNNPLPRLFQERTPAGPRDDLEPDEPRQALRAFLEAQVGGLAATSLMSIRMATPAELLSGESALGGAAKNDYAARAAKNDALHAFLRPAVDKQSAVLDCPPDDPLTTDSILRRATMMSCAGCHAPALFLGEDRKIGCGMTWPESLGEVHIDERGDLSPALKEVFLPFRAERMTALLHACRIDEGPDP